MKKNLFIKILVVFLAILLWVQQSLLKTHTDELMIPIRFVNISTNLVLLDDEIPMIPVTLEGRGLDFFILKLSNVYFEINAKNFIYGQNHYQIKESNLRNFGRMKINIDKKNLENKTSINLDKIIEAKKSIEILYASAKDEEFFIQNKIINSLQKVKVKGPKSILNSIKRIKTEKISSKKIKDGKLTAQLINPDTRVQLIKNTVVLEITHTKLINRTISLIPITYPLDQEITIIPQKVSIMIRGPKEIVDILEKNSIEAYINLKDIKKIETGKSISVDVNFNLPSGIQLIDYTPRKIKILKND
jgi:hypothetical protein